MIRNGLSQKGREKEMIQLQVDHPIETIRPAATSKVHVSCGPGYFFGGRLKGVLPLLWTICFNHASVYYICIDDDNYIL